MVDTRGPAEKQLAALLAEYLGTTLGGAQIAAAIVEVVRTEMQDHEDSSPHIYADGSTS